MSFATQYLWLIPLLPLIAAGLTALMRKSARKPAAALAIGSMTVSFVLSCLAFVATLNPPEHGEVFRHVQNFTWFEMGESAVRLGFVLDPLSAIMLVMVTFVGLLIFIYSVGYMAHDENFTRFFCFLALFAAAMLGIVVANSLLLLFISWELVGLASYLLIGFWYHKPSAAAAAKKAFITTRIGDVAFLLGMVWLYSKTGTLLFYDHGNGCLETATLAKAFPLAQLGAMSLLGIAVLIFIGAMGKSGQVPLHVWLPDAMEGPTPVSALIHAATMVAAGVFLVARVFALMKPDWVAMAGPNEMVTVATADATPIITWIGAITAVFAALIAVAQTDIKRILAYSTVSQLGYMMIGLGVGGVAVGMFHLITHAFFKALLFLGSGSVIHGCHEEQDIRRMGGLKKFMPVTFVTYAVGMLALAGFPLFFSGFWSKDEILHAAWLWQPSKLPFILAVIGAFLTAFYMTRQVCYVFFGQYRPGHDEHVSATHARSAGAGAPHESPPVMTVPLIILAVFAVLLGFVGTPAWPWFHGYLNGHHPEFHFGKLLAPGTLTLMGLSAGVVIAAIASAWSIYSRAAAKPSAEIDPLEVAQPTVFGLLRDKFLVDEAYEATVIRLNRALAIFSDWLDRAFWGGAVGLVSLLTLGLSKLNRTVDEDLVNGGFDQGCESLRGSSRFMSKLQDGQVQNYLRTIGISLVALLLLLIWGCQR